MKKANFSFVLVAFSTLLFFTSCSSYGPAFSHQRITYMERPFGEEVQTQVYASGKFGSDATYKPSETSQNGELGVHIALNSPYIQAAAGVLGFGGQYKDQTNKTFGYNGFGFRLHQNWKIPVNENLEIQIFGYGYTFNSERGEYEKLRIRSFNSTNSVNVDSISGVKDLGVYSITTGVRYRTSNKVLLGFQYAYGSTAFIFAPVNASHCLSFTGGFKNTGVALNISIPQRGEGSFKAGLKPTISVGITQGLTKNGL
jgi:hypothetical protein